MADILPCQPVEDDLFSATNRLRCEKYVLSIQRKLDKAVASGDKEKIRWITHLLTRRSQAVKILSTYRITSNSGSQTAGVDGVAIPKGGNKKRIRKQLLCQIDTNKKPSPIRRTYIPKANGKKRPLGIATLTDRIIADVVKTVIEPIAEYHFSHQSFGFRPKRRAMDAIDKIFKKKARTNAPQWVIEGDIRGCFDEINHSHVLSTMKEWQIPKPIRKFTQRTLKAQILELGRYTQNEEGTQQGSPLSPMLANIALTALDRFCQNVGNNKKSVNPLVRYCDDFIIVCKTKEEATQVKGEVTTFLREKIGLELSQEKTHITHICEGFNFLGFSIRKYAPKSPRSKYHRIGKLLIQPQREKIKGIKSKCAATIRNFYGEALPLMLKALNPQIRGFALYYRHVVSSKRFGALDHWLRRKIWRWLRRNHPKKSVKWMNGKYLSAKADRFTQAGMFNANFSDIPIVRYISLQDGVRVYDGNPTTQAFWKRREFQNALDQIYSVRVEKLIKRQKGICLTCDQSITAEQIQAQQVHVHHVIPQSEGGDDWLSNLTLLHRDCHQLLHAVFSRREMAQLFGIRLKYYGKRAVDEELAKRS